jgi:hypothetical protein
LRRYNKEAAPPELEAIVKALLDPLLGMLGILATGTLNAAAAEAAAAVGHGRCCPPRHPMVLEP